MEMRDAAANLRAFGPTTVIARQVTFASDTEEEQSRGEQRRSRWNGGDGRQTRQRDAADHR